MFEPAGKLSYRRLLCDDHAAEISGLGFCSTHRKLAEASEMCEDCAAARGSPSGADRAVALLSWMKRSEDGEKDLRCSCCDVSLESGFYSPYLFLKPSWPAAVECTEKEDLIEHLVDDGDCEEMDREMDEEEKKDEEISSFVRIKDSSLEMLTVGMDDGFVEDERVVPVELIDSTTFDKTDADYWPSEYQFVVCHSAVDVVPSVLDAETAAVPELVEVIKECSSVPPAEVVDEGCLSQHQNDVPRITEVVGVGNEPFDLAKEFGEMQDIEVGSIAASEDLGEAQGTFFFLFFLFLIC